MIITIKSVMPEETGKKWNKIKVFYTSGGRELPPKYVVSFGDTEKAYKLLASASPGSTFDVTEDETKYRNWIDIKPVEAAAASAPVRSNVKGSYETSDERAERQKYIVRQSSLSNAVALETLRGNKKASNEDIIALAELFFTYVMEGGDKILQNAPLSDKDVMDALKDMESDIPF